MEKDKKLIEKCRSAWEMLSAWRSRRRRCKDFTFGRQWGDRIRLASGRVLTEEQQALESGRVPATNNLIGRMMRQIVGYYRYLTRRESAESGNVTLQGTFPYLEEIDARTLEEFVMSGIAVQRINSEKGEFSGRRVSCFSPERLFFHRFSRPDASDVRFVGLLHDMTFPEVIERFNLRDLATINRAAEQTFRGETAAPCFGSGVIFDSVDIPDMLRVVEVWQRSSVTMLSAYDPETGEIARGELSGEAQKRIELINSERERASRRQLLWSVKSAQCLEQVWLLADGTVIERNLWPPATPLPIQLRLYPMIDGEVHSMVENVIDQQKFINRLVGLLDEILGASAKGAVLYPVDQLPDGMTWRELRQLWSSPSAILPFKRTSKSIQPRQLSGGGNCAGATELLRTQLTLFDDIAGSGGMMSTGSSRATGADMARMQRDSAAISMLDVLSSFREFTARRDEILEKII